MSAPLFPLFLKLDGRRVVVVGGGAMAAQRVRQLAESGALVAVVAPEVRAEIEALASEIERRPFRGADVDGAWLVIAAATPEVNRAVAAAAEARGIFVNAVDDPATATAYCGGVVRRGGAVVAVSTEGRAPALAGLLREGIAALLPAELEQWTDRAEELRAAWKQARIAMADRRPLLLRALNELYANVQSDPTSTSTSTETATPTSTSTGPLSPTLGGACGAKLASRAASGFASVLQGASPPPLHGAREMVSAASVLPPPGRGRAGERVELPHASTSSPSGFVSLVGAGPGDPDLLTVKAVRRLGEADLVLYDALVNGEVLRHAPRAHCFFVGKRAGLPSIAQETIHRMLVDAARLGKRVVRLKCGDPFVLGRGGEEALALEAAGVAYEVVPGLSSALAAPALAGIPVTHRGLASGFAVVSGHAPEAYQPALRSLEPGSLTVVVLMGLAHRAEIAAALLARGWNPTTPAAIAFAAGTASATTWLGTIAGLAAARVAAGGPPGTIVVGEVVTLARESNGQTHRHEPEHSRVAST
jgi:uroporphyrin-III C-methyltransferase/precorrin-2 dehydrogenase/sirohydrochlorin ferrochelatase